MTSFVLRPSAVLTSSALSSRICPGRFRASGFFGASLLAASLVSSLGLSAHGQTAPAAPTPAAPADQTPTFSTNADEVSLDLVVHDKKRKPVLDLTAADITITDEGTPVKLDGFRLVRGDANTSHMVTLVFDRFEGPLAKNAKLMAEKILKTLPTQGYAYSVLDFGGRLRLLQGYTEDHTMLEQAITVATDNKVTRMVSTLSQGVNVAHDAMEPERVKAAETAEKNLISIARTGVDLSGKRVDMKDRTRAKATLKALEDAQLIVQDQHANRALAGILALVRSEQQISERKAVIYFTLNELLDSQSKEMLKTIAGAATKAGVSIYTVDMDAMNIAGQRSVENAMLNGQTPYSPQPIATSAYTSVTPVQQQSGYSNGSVPSIAGQSWGPSQDLAQMSDFMRGNNEDPNRFLDIKNPISSLSKDTGGLYIDAQVNVKGALAQMAEDLSTYYEASYIPPPQDYDGKFRAIDVKPIRTGLRVQAKTGYFSLPPGAAGGMRPFEAPLLKGLASEKLPADFKFNATVLRFGDLPDGNTNALAVEVPFSGIDVKQDTHTNLYSARVAVVAEIKDSGGTVIEHFAEDIARRGALETLDRDKSLAVTMQRHFMEIPGKYTLEVAVKDENSDKMSAQRIPFEIFAPVSGPAMSDMVLVRKMDTYNEDADPLEPLHYESGKVTPNLSGAVPHDAKSVSLFLILHPDPAAKDSPTLEMQVIRNGKPGRRTPLPLHLGAKDAVVPYLATFQTKSMAPGEYKVKATMSQGGDTALGEIAFTVEGQPGEEVADATPRGSGAGVAMGPADDAVPSVEVAPEVPGQLSIVASSNPIPPPTEEEADALIGDARERAVGYKDGLPNFLCVEVIDRSIDPNGTGRWKHLDTITELMKYREKTEARTVLEVNGKQAASPDPEAIRGPKSTGEFGSVLDAVFAPSAQAEFKWKETDVLGAGTVQVFEYHVAKEHSAFSVEGANGYQPNVGFHGKVFVDSSTRSVRRITLVADGLTADMATQASMVAVDYDYVSINAHDYLMPVSAEVSLIHGRHLAMLNTIAFRDYKRFGSNMRVLNFRAPQDAQSAPEPMQQPAVAPPDKQ